MTPPAHNPVLPHALRIPAFNKLHGKRVILASSSPRRREILEVYGLKPEVVASTFKEDLPKELFDDKPEEYVVATAGEKATEVYERLVTKDPEDAPDLIISADTVVIFPPLSEPASAPLHEKDRGVSRILEKPSSKADNLDMLLSLNGQTCEVITACAIAFPILKAPGFELRSYSASTLVTFVDNSESVLRGYVESGEGVDKAGGFGIQGLGGLLIEKIDGDYNNVVGFPAALFFRWLGELIEEEEILSTLD